MVPILFLMSVRGLRGLWRMCPARLAGRTGVAADGEWVMVGGGLRRRRTLPAS
jgi:hypothetical protein